MSSNLYYIPFFAQYGCGAYGESSYDGCSEASASTSTTTTTTSNSELSDTGQGALIGVVVGGALVTIALLLLAQKIIKKIKNKK